ncbi:MAG: UDP-N-acetylmuramate dehydrogenase [Crocinitomix sp.]|nr:UDP-N-acetylmuramate dehydrogenase [Crocinitomix sp.]
MIQENINLQPHNTFGLESIAKNFASFNSIDELKALLTLNQTAQHELLVLGGGSNILLTKDFDGLVLKNDLMGIEVISEDSNQCLVKASAGEEWHEFVLYAIKNNLGGIENLSLIPGSVGASPMQNIGAYGVEIKDVFHELEALNIETLTIETFNAEQCSFGYRESVFKRTLKGKYVILNMTLNLTKVHELNTSYGAIENQLAEMEISKPTIKNVSDAVISIRQSKLPDPKKIGNSGSFFKNPVIGKKQFAALKEKFPNIAHYPLDEDHIKLAAGWLIDQAGWKGKTIENYGVHKNQALVLVNYGGANGQDIYNLSQAILESIQTIYGVTLEREVNII